MFEIDGIHPYAEATGLSAVFPVRRIQTISTRY